MRARGLLMRLFGLIPFLSTIFYNHKQSENHDEIICASLLCDEPGMKIKLSLLCLNYSVDFPNPQDYYEVYALTKDHLFMNVKFGDVMHWMPSYCAENITQIKPFAVLIKNGSADSASSDSQENHTQESECTPDYCKVQKNDIPLLPAKEKSSNSSNTNTLDKNKTIIGKLDHEKVKIELDAITEDDRKESDTKTVTKLTKSFVKTDSIDKGTEKSLINKFEEKLRDDKFIIQHVEHQNIVNAKEQVEMVEENANRDIRGIKDDEDFVDEDLDIEDELSREFMNVTSGLKIKHILEKFNMDRFIAISRRKSTYIIFSLTLIVYFLWINRNHPRSITIYRYLTQKDTTKFRASDNPSITSILSSTKDIENKKSSEHSFGRTMLSESQANSYDLLWNELVELLRQYHVSIFLPKLTSEVSHAQRLLHYQNQIDALKKQLEQSKHQNKIIHSRSIGIESGTDSPPNENMSRSMATESVKKTLRAFWNLSDYEIDYVFQMSTNSNPTSPSGDSWSTNESEDWEVEQQESKSPLMVEPRSKLVQTLKNFESNKILIMDLKMMKQEVAKLAESNKKLTMDLQTEKEFAKSVKLKSHSIERYLENKVSELSKELIDEKTLRQVSENALKDTKICVDEIMTLRSRIEELQNEASSSERFFNEKIGELEKQSHERWMQFCKLKRDHEELTTDRNLYRTRYLELCSIANSKYLSKFPDSSVEESKSHQIHTIERSQHTDSTVDRPTESTFITEDHDEIHCFNEFSKNFSSQDSFVPPPPPPPPPPLPLMGMMQNYLSPHASLVSSPDFVKNLSTSLSPAASPHYHSHGHVVVNNSLEISSSPDFSYQHVRKEFEEMKSCDAHHYHNTTSAVQHDSSQSPNIDISRTTHTKFFNPSNTQKTTDV